LLEVAESLCATLEKATVLSAAVRAVADGVSRPGSGRPAHAAFHALTGQDLVITVAVDEPAGQQRALGFTYAPDRNQAARPALRTGRAALVRPDHMTGPFLEMAEQLAWRALIMAPVYVAGSPVGLLAATTRDTGVVDRHQLQMLEVLARITGLALGNAEDLERERDDAERWRDLSASGIPSQVSAELTKALAPIRTFLSQGNGGGDRSRAESLAAVESLFHSIESQAALDARTRLLRRDVGLLSLQRDVARAHRSLLGRHCLAYLAIKPFKTHGLDDLLPLIADSLRARLREEDLVFLDKEDGIVCSLADMDVRTAWPIFDEIRSELAERLGEPPFNIGLASLRDGDSAAQLLRSARAAVAPDPNNAKRPRARASNDLSEQRRGTATTGSAGKAPARQRGRGSV
jgi:hypothetical protein